MLTALEIMTTTLFWSGILLTLISPFPKYLGDPYRTVLLALIRLGVIFVSVIAATFLAIAFNPPVRSVPGMVITHLSVGPLILGNIAGVRLERLIGGYDQWMFMTSALAVAAIVIGIFQSKTQRS